MIVADDVVAVVVKHQALADGDHRVRDVGVDIGKLCAQLAGFIVLAALDVASHRVDDGGREPAPRLDEGWDLGDGRGVYYRIHFYGHDVSFVNDLTQCQVRIVVYQICRVLSRVG